MGVGRRHGNETRPWPLHREVRRVAVTARPAHVVAGGG
ncbi:hypothetical protein SCATT_p08740 (plasmid) [Streptantibioticus cattleyicolor NRRL 8057 = DSM 46488]|uniref:Uncharacterized protein n=1 Tax=Streptantibioticus cattleyicolor (strain ATCC 35852 / DSM 46488 / JCM 4925 / NBRC 14057 / NRRL 8057) TaxID=1003195 RepID=G8XDC0_STREN|nr:hypothetical protein SCATT_p08740 [Streptantibioticus cattleyicolor NRRL 8057 = DSM 46488]